MRINRLDLLQADSRERHEMMVHRQIKNPRDLHFGFIQQIQDFPHFPGIGIFKRKHPGGNLPGHYRPNQLAKGDKGLGLLLREKPL